MTMSSEKELLQKSVEEDDSLRMRKKSPSSRKRNVTKYGSIKSTDISVKEMPRNIKNAEGTNTHSFYYVSMDQHKHQYDVTTSNDDVYDIPTTFGNDDTGVQTGRKLVPDPSWGGPFPFSKLSDDRPEETKVEMTSFSQYEFPIAEPGGNEIIYEVRKTTPGGFPFIKLAQPHQTDDVKTGDVTKPSNSANAVSPSEKSTVTSRHAWLSTRNLLNVFNASRRHPPPILPKCILDAIELSDKIEIQESFGVMREGETLLMVEHTRWITRTVNTICKLEDDCIRVSYIRSRCCLPNMNWWKRKESFDIRDVIMARAGRDGLLRVIQGDLPETRCFSIVFKGGKKTMNFLAPDDDSAKCWVRGLNFIKKKLDNLSPRLRQYLFLWEMFRKADQDNDGQLTFPEVHELFRRKGGLVTREDRIKIVEHFVKKVTTEDPFVDFSRFVEFYQTASLLPEFESIFKKYSADKRILTAREIYKFLQESQGEYDVTEEDCVRIIEDYEINDEIREKTQMSVHGFVTFMLSPNCDVFNRRHDEVYQDMKHPLSHYFIASSHNTYLMADQLRGPSSTDAYMKALLQGCRCVELDCWDGTDGEPTIFHGHTLTSKIKFKDAIEVIGKFAFESSRYPLILSIENHCSVKQQEKMAEYMQRILGTELLTKANLPACDEEQLPSPTALQGKILLKGKKLPPVSLDSEDSVSDGDVSDEDEAAEMNVSLATNRRRPLQGLFPRQSVSKSKESSPGKESIKTRETVASSQQSLLKTREQEKKLKLSKNLSDQVIYCKSCKFKGIDEALRSTNYKNISSFTENKALRLAEREREKTIKFHVDHLNRTYPGATRTDSSNYNPQPLWNAGFQIVALNYQTKCDEMTLYHAKFRQNGRSGYVLKPEFMTSHRDVIVREEPKDIVITVICGSDIAVVAHQQSLLVVEVAVHGDPKDEKKQRTKAVCGNGYNPVWDESLKFKVSVPSLAMAWFRVFNEVSTNVGQFALPLTSISEGYRTVHLLDRDGNSLKHSHLLVHITVTQQSRNHTSYSSNSRSSSSRSGRSSNGS